MFQATPTSPEHSASSGAALLCKAIFTNQADQGPLGLTAWFLFLFFVFFLRRLTQFPKMEHITQFFRARFAWQVI